MTKNYLATQAIKTDELGRMIVEDLALLEKINGAYLGTPDILISDGACGNSNCVC